MTVIYGFPIKKKGKTGSLRKLSWTLLHISGGIIITLCMNMFPKGTNRQIMSKSFIYLFAKLVLSFYEK